MTRFIEGAERGQTILLPECLDDYVDDDNAVGVDVCGHAESSGKRQWTGDAVSARGRTG